MYPMLDSSPKVGAKTFSSWESRKAQFKYEEIDTKKISRTSLVTYQNILDFRNNKTNDDAIVYCCQ